MHRVVLLLVMLICPGTGLLLTEHTWEAAVRDKPIFVAFTANWSSRWQHLRPTWQNLSVTHGTDAVTAEVDCVGDGISICKSYGVKAYPSLMYGEEGFLNMYSGGHGITDLENVVKGLATLCRPSHPDFCDDRMKKNIDRWEGMTLESLTAAIKAKEQYVKELEEGLNLGQRQLRAEMEERKAKYEADLAVVYYENGEDYHLLRAVQQYEKAKQEL